MFKNKLGFMVIILAQILFIPGVILGQTKAELITLGESEIDKQELREQQEAQVEALAKATKDGKYTMRRIDQATIEFVPAINFVPGTLRPDGLYHADADAGEAGVGLPLNKQVADIEEAGTSTTVTISCTCAESCTNSCEVYQRYPEFAFHCRGTCDNCGGGSNSCSQQIVFTTPE